jgi:hypothetical protein
MPKAATATAPAARAAGPGCPQEYCEGRGHTKVTTWRERRRLAAAEVGTTTGTAGADNPVTMAKVAGTELLRALRAEVGRLRDTVETVTGPTAAEARWKPSAPRPSSAPPRPTSGVPKSDGAAAETATQLAAAQVGADQAEEARAVGEAERDARRRST